MDNNSIALEWLKSAKANLFRGNTLSYINNDEVPFSLLCFDLQQCVEKSLKAVLISHNINAPKTHDISKLIDMIAANQIEVPEEIILQSVILTQYASETRYPGDWEPISIEEYKKALKIAENVYNFAKEIIK